MYTRSVRLDKCQHMKLIVLVVDCPLVLAAGSCIEDTWQQKTDASVPPACTVSLCYIQCVCHPLYIISLWNWLPQAVIMATGLEDFNRGWDRFVESKSFDGYVLLSGSELYRRSNGKGVCLSFLSLGFLEAAGWAVWAGLAQRSTRSWGISKPALSHSPSLLFLSVLPLTSPSQIPLYQVNWQIGR